MTVTSLLAAYLPQILALIGLGVGILLGLGAAVTCAFAGPDISYRTRAFGALAGILGIAVFIVCGATLACLAVPV